jgi:hypothetical protein
MPNASNSQAAALSPPGKTWYGHPVSEVLAAIEAHQGPRAKPSSTKVMVTDVQTTTSHRGLFILFTCALLLLGVSRRVIEARVETESDPVRPRPVASAREAVPLETQRHGMRSSLGLGVSLISVLARLRELASDDQVTLASITVPRSASHSTPPELRESLVRLTVTGPAPALLTFTEDVSADKLPLVVQSADLTQLDPASPSCTLQLGLAVLESTAP